MSNPNPVIALSIEKPTSLEHVQQWAACAEALGFPSSSVVDVSMTGTLQVRAYTHVLGWPALPGEEKPPSTANAAAFCHSCTHRWHGLRCRTCACPSAWVPPE